MIRKTLCLIIVLVLGCMLGFMLRKGRVCGAVACRGERVVCDYVPLSPMNKGLETAVNRTKNTVPLDRTRLKKVLGVRAGTDVGFSITGTRQVSGLTCREGVFAGYDGLDVPFYEVLPPGFNDDSKYPAVILFSGHGTMDQVCFEERSYQRGAACVLARSGFVVYCMENRGMGRLSVLGDHLRLDAVARLAGGSWYGEIISDGLVLLNRVFAFKYIDADRVGCGGISTGGALALYCGALDERVKAVYVQGYMGSFRKTFGPMGNHCICNNIASVLEYCEMSDVAGMIAPRFLRVVNGSGDDFFWQDAKDALVPVHSRYEELGAGSNIDFHVPENTGHEMSVGLLTGFFKDKLAED